MSWIVPSHHRSQEYYRGVYHRSITEEYYRGYGIQTQRNSGAAPRQCTGEGTYLKRRHMAKKFLVFLTLSALHPTHFLGGKGRRMTSCGRNESPQFSFPPSLLLHGEKYQHKCYCGRRGWVASPNPMEVLAGSIVRTSLR